MYINTKQAYTTIKQNTSEVPVPSVLPLLQNHKSPGLAGTVDHPVELSIPYFSRLYSDRWLQKFKLHLIKVVVTVAQECGCHGTRNFHAHRLSHEDCWWESAGHGARSPT